MKKEEAFEFPLEQLREVQKRCYDTAEQHGWWDKYDRLRREHPEIYKEFLPEIIGSKLALLHSEVSEALEELRNGRNISEIYYSAKVEGKAVIGNYEAMKSFMAMAGCRGEPKPEGVPIEIADVIIRALDLGEREGMNLAEAIQIKMRYNDSRSYKHGGKKI